MCLCDVGNILTALEKSNLRAAEQIRAMCELNTDFQSKGNYVASKKL